MPGRTAFARACRLAVDAVLSRLAEPRVERDLRRNVNEVIGESFPRRLRLTQAIEFQQVFKNNFRSSDACLTILVGKNAGDLPRLGFAIARKQVPKAIQRNALKRLFRESFRKNWKRLPARDMVIMVRREILSRDAAELRGALDQHWNSIIEQCDKS